MNSSSADYYESMSPGSGSPRNYKLDKFIDVVASAKPSVEVNGNGKDNNAVSAATISHPQYSEGQGDALSAVLPFLINFGIIDLHAEIRHIRESHLRELAQHWGINTLKLSHDKKYNYSES